MARTAFTNKKPSPKQSQASESSSMSMMKANKTTRKQSASIKAPRITEPAESASKRGGKKNTSMVLKEIQYYQQTSNMLMSKLPFVRMVRSSIEKLSSGSRDAPIRFTHSSLEALQEAFEAFVVSLFENAYCCTIHAKRVTLYPSDLRLARRLKK